MVEVRLREEFGGTIPHKNVSEAVLWCQREREDWETSFTLRDDNGAIVHNEAIECVDHVRDAWKQLELILSKSVDDNRVIDFTDTIWTQEQTVVVARSVAGQALIWIYRNLNNKALNAGFAVAGLTTPTIDWMDTSSTAGAFHYARITSGSYDLVTQEKIRATEEAWADLNQKANKLFVEVRSASSDIDKQAKEAISKISEAQSDIESSYIAMRSQFSDTLSDLNSLTGESVSQMNSYLNSVNSAKDSALEQMEKSRLAFREEVILQPAAQLWHDRAEEHEGSAKNFGIAAIATGAVGIVGTPAMAFGINALSRCFINTPESLNIPADRSLDFANTIMHTQLIVAASVTLLWVTMSLWITRVLVRNYMQQRRLAVDAAGREAMAQTYIGLMLEGGVKDTERPIVLSNLFLPISDGTTDDGPPVITVPSLLATLAAGKQ